MKHFNILCLLTALSCPSCSQTPSPHHHLRESGQPNNTVQPIVQSNYSYDWLKTVNDTNSLANRIQVPDGYERLPERKPSFQDWLRHLPLKAGQPDVFLFDGTKKWNQKAHEAVFDIPIGDKDLQQCADAVMRLRGEYLYETKQYQFLHFNFTSGDECRYDRWIEGYRPKIQGNHVSFHKTSAARDSRKTFDQYMEMIFNYAGTASLEKELKNVGIDEIAIGDIFIQGGFPGHAVIVVDVAQSTTTNEKLFLLAQSYMPAQNIQLLKNPSSHELSPWYSNRVTETINTPEWTFSVHDLRRF